jgi:tetraacyldisaccharide 4'-kinase
VNPAIRQADAAELPEAVAPERRIDRFLLSPWARLLIPLAYLYGEIAAWRRCRVSARAERLAVPVVSVGNLTVGGTGKTPVVEWVIRSLRELGKTPAILSRGYGRVGRQSGAGAVPQGNDEYLVLQENLPDVVHIQNPRRVEGGREALRHGADVLVLDDGFQHVALKRDCDIVLLDAINPFGFGRLLPAGYLREPIETLSTADLIVITRGGSCHPRKLATLRTFLRDRFPRVPRVEVDFEPLSWVRIDAEGAHDEPASSWSGNGVVGFCGIGNPEGFRRELERLGLRVLEWIPFPDHHGYTREDVTRIARIADERQARAVVMTQKDAVKIGGLSPAGSVPWSFLRIAARVTRGETAFWQLLSEAVTDSVGEEKTDDSRTA